MLGDVRRRSRAGRADRRAARTSFSGIGGGGGILAQRRDPRRRSRPRLRSPISGASQAERIGARRAARPRPSGRRARGRRTGRAGRGTGAAARCGASAPPCAASVVVSPSTAAIRRPISPVAARKPSGASASAISAKTSASARGRVGAVEQLVAHLDIFRRAVRGLFLRAEHLAGIGVARRLGAVVHVHLHHRHGEIRAQHRLAQHRVGGDVGARADILAVEVEQRLGRLQDRRSRPRSRPRASKTASSRAASARIGGLVGRQPSSAVQDLAHLGHQIVARHLDLARGAPSIPRASRSRRSCAPRIRSLICTTPRAFSSAPSITATGEAALVGVFELVAEVLRVAEIDLGADARPRAARPPSPGSRPSGRGPSR